MSLDTSRDDARRRRARKQAADWVVKLHARPELASSRAFRRWAGDPDNASALRCAAQAWDLAPEVGRQLARPAPVTAPNRTWLSGWVLSGSALTACAALAAAWLAVARPDLLMQWQADLAAPRGTAVEVTLADGTAVLLDAGSGLDVVSMDGTRVVRLLHGQAHFDVAHTGAPFVVEAEDARVRVLGTRFDVRLAGEAAEVTLEEGRVAVGTGAPGGETVEMVPGQRLRVTSDGPGMPAEVDLAEAAAWRSGRYVFHDRPLAEVVEELERHGKGRILVADPELAARPVTGSILLADHATALEALATSQGARILNLPGNLRLLRR